MRPCRLSGSLAFLLLVLTVPGTGYGDDQAEKGGDGRGTKVFELGEIVVTEEKTTASQVGTVTEVTREEFQSRGVNTVADALRYVPGAQVSLSQGALSGNGKREELIRLRGFETTDILILLDGMPMTEPYLKRVDLNQITLDNVAKIKVVKGPSSVLYGPNTAGGLVNVVSQQGQGFQTFIDQRFGDYESFRTIAQNQGSKGPVNYILGGSWDRSDGFPISRDFEGALNQQGTLRANSDYERYNVGGRIGADIADQGKVSLGGAYYDFGGGVPYSMSALNLSDLWRKDWNRWYLNGFGEWNFTDRLGARGQLFYNQFDNEITSYTDTTFSQIKANGNAISTYDNTIFGYFLNPYWNLGQWSSLRAGIRYDKQTANIQPNTTDSWQKYVSEIYSFALEDEIRPWEPLSLVAGVGYNLYRKIEAYHKDPGSDVDNLEFQFGVLYTPISWLVLHGGVARKTSYPTMRDLYGEYGNVDLSDQDALSYEIGAAAEFGGPYPGGSLALFRSDVNNLIAKKERGTDYSFENVASAVLQGLELDLHWYPLDGVGLFVNYTFLDTENESTGKPINFRPPHVVNFEASYLAPFGLEGSLLYSYISSQSYEPSGQPNVEERLPARGIWELHLSQKFPFERYPLRYIEVYVDVDNLLDEYYEDDPRLAAPGRMVWAGLRGAF